MLIRFPEATGLRMIGDRFIAAGLLIACALVAAAIVALSIDAAVSSTDEEKALPLRAPQVETMPPLARSKAAPAARAAKPRDDAHSALPRLWLGGPPR
jgi:hypothetical protein